MVVQSGRSGRTSATPCSQVEILHDVALAAVQVHGAGVHRRRRPVQIDGAQQPAGVLVDDRDLSAAAAAQVDPVGGMPRSRPRTSRSAGGAAPAARPGPASTGLIAGPPNSVEVRLGQVPLGRGAGQVRAEDVRVGRVDDGRLHGRPNTASGWCTR